MDWVKTFIARFRSSEFTKDTAVLTLGTAVAQLVAIAAMPVMSRLYTPSDFGVLAVFLAVSSIVATAITLRYETSILLPKEESEAVSLVLLSLALTLVLGSVIGITAWLLPEKIRVMLGVSVLVGWLPIAVLAGVATAVVAIGTGWFNRQRAYIKMTYLRITQSGVGAVCGITLGIYGYTTGLFMAQIISLLVLTAVVMFSLRAMCVHWSEPAMRNVAMKHSAAPKYLLPTALLDVVTLQLPVMLITVWFSSEEAGQFSMAWKILALPMALIGGAVGQVFFQRISADIHLDMHIVCRRYIKVSMLLGMAAIAPTLLTAIYGQEIFTLVLGQQWRDSGKMAELLVYSTTMYFIFSPTTSILLVLGKQKVLLQFSIAQLAYRFGVALISNDVMDYIRWLVICEFINVVLFELTIVYCLNRESESGKMISIRKIYSLIRMKVYFWRLKIRNQDKDAKEVFSDYWKKNHWQNAESKSGDGSTLLYTEHIRREIPLLLKRLQATSLLDAPCGDFNWCRQVKLGQDVSYVGGDIVDGMIAELIKKYACDSRKFIVLDVISGKLPSVDIWMCRDLIFHLPTEEIFKLIDNFLSSEVKYLLITSHAAREIGNEDTFMGGFRLINLLNAPFAFPEPEERMKDYIEGFPERYLLLYKRETLQAWKERHQR